MTSGLILVRHPPVAEAYRDVCYGSSDVPLSSEATASVERIVAEVCRRASTKGRIVCVYHSGSSRCAGPAGAIAAHLGLEAIPDSRLRERHFGAWELRSWDAIYEESGDAMMGMVSAPESWRPPGGESTFELRDRVLSWYRDLPSHGAVVAVSHGGPIAALLGTLREAAVEHWPRFIPECGALVAVPLPRRS